MEKIRIIRYIYLYLLTAISIVLVLVSTIGLINLALSEYVFDVKGYNEVYKDYYQCGEGYNGVKLSPEEMGNQKVLTDEEIAACKLKIDEQRVLEHKNDIKRDLVTWLSMLLVSLPLYFYHWGIIKKENKK